MLHHTAAPVPYPVNRLIGSRLKANINTKPDGKVWLLAYKACNYSSGPGNYSVLRDVRLGIVPTQNAVDRNLADTTNGNPHFFNFENDHLGHGEPLPQAQFDAIVAATQVVADHFGLDAPTQTISHAEWTKRKADPYWNNNRRAIETIRAALGDTMTMSVEAQEFFQDAYDKAMAELDPPTSSSYLREVVKHLRNHPGGSGGLTEAQVLEIINNRTGVFAE